MASHSSDDQGRYSAIITEALSGDITPETTSAAATREAAGDPKQLFCENWDTVKAVLGFLRQYGPGFLKPIIDIVIKAGDALKRAIC